MGTRRIRRDDGEYTLFFRKVSPFSNHHPAEFDCDESINFKETKRFSCTEQYYMYNKASLLKDCPLMEEILNCDNPREMKMMCSNKNLRNWCEYTWNRCKQEVMYTGCTAKFRTSKHLRFVLFLSTGSNLVECSPFDRVWGIGKDLEAALTSSMDAGQNLLGKILDRVREELWNDREYRDEREEVESRMRKDEDYLLKAMEQVDLMFKGRATQRYLLAQGHIYRDNQSYVSSDVLALIPEWAVPPILQRDEPITASPPQFHNFQRAPPLVRPRSVSPRGPSRLAGRINYIVTRPARTDRDRRRSRDRSHSPRSRYRSNSRSRNRSRSRSRHDRRRSRSRSRHQRPTTSMQSGQRESKNSERSPHRRRRSRSKSREDRRRRRSRSHDRDRRSRRTRSRSSHRSKRYRSRSRSRSRHRKRLRSSESDTPEEEYLEGQKEKRVKRRKLRPNANRSRPLERSDDVREPRSESQEECYQTLKKMRKLLKRRAKEKRKRERKPPSSTSSESEAEKPSRGRVEIASGSSSSTSNNSSVIIVSN